MVAVGELDVISFSVVFLLSSKLSVDPDVVAVGELEVISCSVVFLLLSRHRSRSWEEIAICRKQCCTLARTSGQRFAISFVQQFSCAWTWSLVI